MPGRKNRGRPIAYHARVFKPLAPATPAFDDAGTPASPRYGDVYLPAQSGADQARHVFVAGNDLPERWQGRDAFTVFETGFGLGLNFLATWAAWRDDPARCARLHMVSVEAHPFSRDDLARMQSPVLPPAWRALADALLATWPPLLPGVHRLDFDDGAVTLTLALGEARDMMPQLSLRADAFYLDGFAPAVNPEMWSEYLLRAVTRHAAPGATLATWCSVGAVRRALVTVGFEVTRRPGIGGKFHMTVGRYAPRFTPRHVLPQVPVVHERHAVVVGAGVAGAGVAHALWLRGWRVTVIDDAPQRHAGHAAAALTPMVARDDSPRARLSRAGALRARARWLADPALAQAVSPCGTLHLMRGDRQVDEAFAAVDALKFPPEWLQAVDTETASQHAGRPVARGGYWLAQGMQVRPAALCDALLARPGITRIDAHAARLNHDGERWQVCGDDGALLAQAEVVVLASSVDTPALLAASGVEVPALAAMHGVTGQISLVDAEGVAPRCVVAGEGYVLPAVDGRTVLGSTYLHDASAPAVTDEGHAVNLAKLQALMPEAQPGPVREGWSGWRAVRPGRLPLVGAVPGSPGLWLATGYASRGLSWSALGGDLIAAQLCGEPLPLEKNLLQVIAPG